MLLRRRRSTLRPAARRAATDLSAASGPAPPHGGPLGSTPVEELERLAKLHADGELTDAEFSQAKSRLLGTEGNGVQGP